MESKVIDGELVNALKYGGLDRTNLTELVSEVSRLHDQGLRALKVFPCGIPAPDGICVRTVVDLKVLQTLIAAIPKIRRFRSIEVFPLGIPAVDQFIAKVELG